MKVTGMTFHGGNKSNSDFPSCHLKRVRFFFSFLKDIIRNPTHRQAKCDRFVNIQKGSV